MSDISKNLYLTFSRTTEFNFRGKLLEWQPWNNISVRMETELHGTQASDLPKAGHTLFPGGGGQLLIKQSRPCFCFPPFAFILCPRVHSKICVGGGEDSQSSVKCIPSLHSTELWQKQKNTEPNPEWFPVKTELKNGRILATFFFG